LNWNNTNQFTVPKHLPNIISITDEKQSSLLVIFFYMPALASFKQFTY